MLDPLLLIATNSPEIAEGANVISQLAGQFDVEWNLLIAQIINFALVAFLLYRFAFKPILLILDERQKKIAAGLKYTEEMEAKLKDAQSEYTEILHKAALEKKEILEAAREQSHSYTEKQTQVAMAEAEHIIKKAHEAIALEKQQMLHDVRKQLAGLVVATSERVLGKNLTQEDRAVYNESAIKELASN